MTWVDQRFLRYDAKNTSLYIKIKLNIIKIKNIFCQNVLERK